MGGNWFTDLYVSAKENLKSSYNIIKHGTKTALDYVGIDSDSKVYKYAAKAAHVTEPIVSGVTETIEFVTKNQKETGSVISDLAGWAIGSDKLDSHRLLNYLYNYSRETGTDVKLLLKELPPESLTDGLKYINNKLSNMKKIPCSQVCMDIALSNPKNYKSEDCMTVDESSIDRIISGFKNTLSDNELNKFKEDLPLVMFNANSKHSKMLQENATMQTKLREWANTPENKRKNVLTATLNADSDPKNGYDAYASFHNVYIMDPKLDEDGNITAYVFDIYDFERASFNGQMLDFATIMAYHLQETGHLQNYKMLIPIKIPKEAVQ